VQAAELVLLHNGRWLGTGKWLARALRRFDPDLAAQLTSALKAFYQAGSKEELVNFAEQALEPVGGRLFEGYYSPGRRKAQRLSQVPTTDNKG
jgi:hypothetical protein